MRTPKRTPIRMRLRETSIPRCTAETCSLHRGNDSGWCVTRAYAGEAIAEARTARLLVPHLREDVWHFADSSGPLRAAATNDDTTVQRSQRAFHACSCPTSSLLSQLLPRLSSFNALNIPPSRGIAIPLDSVCPCKKAAHSEYSLAPVDLCGACVAIGRREGDEMAPRPRAGSRFQILASPSSSPLFAPEARSYAKRGCHDGVPRHSTPKKRGTVLLT